MIRYSLVPDDLSADMGKPGQLETPEMELAIRSVISAAKSAGKSSGIITSKMSLIQKCKKAGMNVFSCNSETGMLMESAKKKVSDFKTNQ